ncbi:hypothetical protein GCM10027317_01710 [Massilia agri]
MDRAEPGALPHLRNPAAGEMIMSQDLRKKSNLKTALVLGGIALFFFASVFVKFTLLS